MALGRKTGGRKAGTRNKKQKEIIDAAAASGEMPAEYGLRIMRDKTVDHERRDEMCRAILPYFHARLSSVEVGGKDGGPIEGRITIEFVSPPARKGK